jgi:hypothetical protein
MINYRTYVGYENKHLEKVVDVIKIAFNVDDGNTVALVKLESPVKDLPPVCLPVKELRDDLEYDEFCQGRLFHNNYTAISKSRCYPQVIENVSLTKHILYAITTPYSHGKYLDVFKYKKWIEHNVLN